MHAIQIRSPMEDLRSFLTNYMRNIEFETTGFRCHNLLEPYRKLQNTLLLCGHDAPELREAVNQCAEAVVIMNDAALAARSRFEQEGFQGTLREQMDAVEKAALT